MPAITQVYSIVNTLYSQSTGKAALANVDASALASIGKEVLSSATNKENFTSLLVDRINKLIVTERAYKGKDLNMKMDPLTFGGVVQKLDVEHIQAKEASTWNVPTGDAYDLYIVKPSLIQRFFSGFDVFELDISIPDVQWETAFTSAEEMLKLITAIYTKLSNSKELALENLAKATRNVMIANRIMYQQDPESVRNSGGKTLVVDLRTSYNTFFGLSSGDTGYLANAAAANRSPDFLRYAVQVINEYKDHFAEYGAQFNQPLVASDGTETDIDRHTPSEYLRLNIVSDFVAQYNSICQSDTFHNELTSLPMYESVSFWQNPNSRRAINVDFNTNYTADGDEDVYTVSQDGIIAVMSDYEAMGVTLTKERRKAVYSNRYEVTCIYEKAERGYFVDPTENCVVFVVADSIATPTVV